MLIPIKRLYMKGLELRFQIYQCSVKTAKLALLIKEDLTLGQYT